MPTAVRAFRLRELWFALALAGVLSGLVGMHHVSATGGGTGAAVRPVAVEHHVPAGAAHAPPARPAPHDDPGGGGHGAPDLLHLCLAVLAGAAVVVIALVLLQRRRHRVGAGPGRTAGTCPGSRGPPLPVPRRLALLCVLRT
jgi:hypothetical protein